MNLKVFDDKRSIKISIIIPVYDNTVGLNVTLKSIYSIVRARNDIEILVCNDGGGDKISKLVALYGYDEIRLCKNMGSYAARNRGISYAHGDIIVFLDADQKVSEQWLDAGLSALQYADYVGGQVIVTTGPSPTSWEIFDKFHAFPLIEFFDKLHFSPTANLFVSKHVFESIGLFNEILRSGGDRDFGLRVYQSGYKQVYCPQAITFHPARNKHEQILKQKRIGSGVAELHCIVWKKKPILYIAYSLIMLFRILFESVGQIFMIITLINRPKKIEKLQFTIINLILKTVYYSAGMLSAAKLILFK